MCLTTSLLSSSWFILFVACDSISINYPDLSQSNGPSFFQYIVPNALLFAPLKSIFSYSGLSPTSQEARDYVKIMCADQEHPDTAEMTEDDMAGFNTSKPLVLFTHGFLEKYLGMPENSIPPAIDTLLKYNDVNACVIDWAQWATFDYITVSTTFKQKTGQFVADFLRDLESMGQDFDDVTLVGHSSGAHVFGYAGNLLEGRIGTIIGLDPAGPYFCWRSTLSPNERLSKASAKYVQTIVTSQNGMGCHRALGHQNFYANSGLFPQPACLGETAKGSVFHCSHYLGTKIFTYSLIPDLVFEAVRKCRRQTSNCTSETDRVGMYAARKHGNFYFNTSTTQPYTV